MWYAQMYFCHFSCTIAVLTRNRYSIDRPLFHLFLQANADRDFLSRVREMTVFSSYLISIIPVWHIDIYTN